jgi:hypothetical protein
MKPGRLVVFALLSMSGGAIGQTTAHPEFEVASIKPSAPDARGTSVRPIGNGISLGNMTLKDMITLAYRVQPFQVSGGPAWFDSVHFDVTAKSENAPRMEDIPLMLQGLLSDRFQLALHHESKELPIYAIVLARKDGKLGPNLTESKEGSCTPMDPTKPPPPPKPGTYDMNAEWTLDDNQLANATPPGAPRPTSPDSAGPSIFTAFQEQLGLKLESQKGPVDVLVIDRAEKPSEN